MLPTKTLPADMARIRSLFGNLMTAPQTLPVSFDYAGRHYASLPEGTFTYRPLDANITEIRYTAALDALVSVVAEIEVYRDYPAVEWTLFFENRGQKDSAILENVLAADITVRGGHPSLITNNGDYYSEEGYTNTVTAMTDGTVLEQCPNGGRACNGAFPYQRLLFDGWGVSIAIGWPAQWSCKWEGLADGAHFSAGQQVLHTVLHAGERIRTPRMAFVAFEGDLERGINVWRRWYHAHVMPRSAGSRFPSLIQCSDNGGGEEWTQATEPQQLAALKHQKENPTGGSLWWIDAGWYPCEENGTNRWTLTGTWKPDPKRFPNGFAPVGKACEEAGLTLLVWFEPERVRPGTELAVEHPEWMLHRTTGDEQMWERQNYLLNLSDPDCLKWICERINGIIQEGGIKVYRQDFNFDPLYHWRDNETADRQGAIENLYVQGYLAYWDYLIANNPDLLIDSCASGGRRNDLETMRRAVPLHQTDYGYGIHPIKQKFTQLLAGWIPYFRGFNGSADKPDGTYENGYYRGNRDTFDFLNHVAPTMSSNNSRALRRDPVEGEHQLAVIALCKRLQPLMHDDFYTFTPQHRSPEQWSAWEYFSPERQEGMLQFFRNLHAPQESFTAKIRGLDENASYVFENGLTGEKRILSGKDAMENGFVETLDKRQASAWLFKKQ